MAQNCNMIFLFDSKLQCKHYTNYRNNSSLFELKLIFYHFCVLRFISTSFLVDKPNIYHQIWQQLQLGFIPMITLTKFYGYSITISQSIRISNSNFLSYLKIRSYPSMSLRSASALTLAGRGASLVFRWIALQVFMLFLVKCYDNKMVKLPYNLIILPLIEPQVANQKKSHR